MIFTLAKLNILPINVLIKVLLGINIFDYTDEIFERVKQREKERKGACVPMIHFSASFQAVSLLLLVPELLLLPPQLLALSGHALGLLAALLRDETTSQ